MDAHNQPAVILVSGGLDSAVLLHHVASQPFRRPIHALSFKYGQRHSRELECAKYQAGAIAAEHRVIDLSWIAPFLAEGAALITGGPDVPDLLDVPLQERDQPPTYVPNRNMIFLSIAAAYAETQGISDVFYGAQAQDEYGYWDCTTQFLERVNDLLALNRRGVVTVYAPFIEMKKAEIVRLGTALGVDFAHTWSCYRGGPKACGACPTCVERLKAFDAAGCRDPIPYAD